MLSLAVLEPVPTEWISLVRTQQVLEEESVQTRQPVSPVELELTAADTPAAPINPRRAPTGTVVSTATSIARRVPATGEGISVSTLSVETSSKASSTATESPTFLSQRVTVPSETLSPSAGIVMTVPAPFEVGAAGADTGAAATGAGVSITGAATGAAGAGVDVPAAPSAMMASSAPTGTV